MGDANRWDGAGELAGRPLMSWDDARRLAARGLRFGAHTRRHPRLPEASPALAEEEIRGSLDDLGREIPGSTRIFAYPHGASDARARRVAGEGGVLCACGTRSGLVSADSPLLDLPRVEIRGTDSLARFLLKVRFGRGRLG
jgi:peptidoglycan/xylan/chitin deacetylase (PgdA/CDA1 family)